MAYDNHQDAGDLVLDPTCVRRGTRVWTVAPTPALPLEGEGAVVPPFAGGLQGGLTPIESIQPGDCVLGHDGKVHRAMHLIRKLYRGALIGLRHALASLRGG